MTLSRDAVPKPKLSTCTKCGLKAGTPIVERREGSETLGACANAAACAKRAKKSAEQLAARKKAAGA